MSEQLSPFRIKRGRRVFDSYSAINSFSFALVTGNTITLYALALGSSSTVVGFLGAFMYLAYFFIPLGKIGTRRGGLVRVFADSWMLRNFVLVPLLAIPYLAARGHAPAGVFLLIVCVFLFNFFRGIGIIANNPVIGSLASGRDRGEYIVRLSLINNGTALVATVLLAFLLWRDSGIETYNLVILVGVVTGLIASSLLYRLPEPPSARDASGGRTETRFFSLLRDYLKKPDFARFILSYLVIGLGFGMARPFIIVYCKAVYGQNDGMVTVFTVCSSLGALLMGAVMRLVIDRLGAKPMYIIFAAVTLGSLVPAIVSPGVGSIYFPIAFLCLLSAVTNMGFAGQESAAQTYFFMMVPKEAIMDLSMLYYFVYGGTGAIGSAAGGAFLDLLAGMGLSSLASFRVFFAVSALVILVGIRLQRKLPDLGSYPVRDTLAVLFSPRDMRALTLLRRLDSTEDPDEETGIIAELGEVASAVSEDVLVDRLSSPRFAVRYEALQSVGSLEWLKPAIRDALLRELDAGEFSTAALSARYLGKFGVRQAIPLLRARLKSPDYRLSGEAMLALARLGDARSQFEIADCLMAAHIPFVLVRGVEALEEYGTAASIPMLLDLLRRDDLPAHIADEIILSLSSLMGVPRKFVYVFEDYARDRKRAGSLLLDALDEASMRCRREDATLKETVSAFMVDQSADGRFVRWILDFGKDKTGVYSALLVSVALDSDLKKVESFRFFLCFWAISAFADPDLIAK